MSRSYRKTTIFGNSYSPSEKEAKKKWHRIFRSKNKGKIKNTIKMDNFDNASFYNEEEAVNVYLLPKDGKSYWSKKSMRQKVEEGTIDKNYIRKIMLK